MSFELKYHQQDFYFLLLLKFLKQLQFHYFFERQIQDRCKDVVLDNLRGVVDPGSKIDFSGFPHYTALPELSLFANGGYPYSRLADMSETAIALPSQLGASEIATYLALMGHLGNSTGYPATRITLTQGADAGAIKDKNVIVLGAAGNRIDECVRIGPDGRYVHGSPFR